MPQLATTDIGKKVEVYYNLNRHVWSVRHQGLVIGHVDTLRLDNVTLRVSQAGRERVLREQRKNVHAFCVGTLSAYGDMLGVIIGGTPVTYNPYKYASFVRVHGEAPVTRADVAYLGDRTVVIAGNIA